MIKPPQHEMKILESYDKSSGFLDVRSKKVEFTYEDATGEPEALRTAEMTIDYVDRKGSFDAVCIVPYFRGHNDWNVYLISCIRPAVGLRDYTKSGRPEAENNLNQWELPAGIVEADEVGNEGILSAASRELKEEVGIFVKPVWLELLGHRVFSSVGLCGERIYFVATEVHPRYQEDPGTDGSPLEQGSVVQSFSITHINDAIRENHIHDAKTIIGLTRLTKYLNL